MAELSEAQQSRMAEVLVSRLTSGAVGSHGSRQALLVALEKLGLAAAADSTLLAILPSLLDPNVCHVCVCMWVLEVYMTLSIFL